MLRLAQQKQELDRQRLTRERQHLEQEEDRMRKEQALLIAELEEDKRMKLAKAIWTELELIEDVLEISQSLRDAFSELSAHSQPVKSVRLTNWISNASTEVEN